MPVKDNFELQELKKCRANPIYFLETYGYISDKIKGKIKFELFNYQKDLLKKFQNNQFNIILKPRQMGISWLVAGYALWITNFNFEKTVEMISIGEREASKLLSKAKYIYGNLPKFLKSYQTSNKTEINFSLIDRDGVEHGLNSSISSLPSSENAGRSDSLSLLIMDEAAFIQWADNIWASAYPTLSTGGSAIILSTANGVGNLFYEMWLDALEKKNNFIPTRLYWHQYPGRDKKWYEQQKKDLSAKKFAQEVDCTFLDSGEGIPIFDSDYLKIKGNKSVSSTNKFYWIGCDVAEGGPTGDYSAIEIIDSETKEEVFSEVYHLKPEKFAKKIKKISERYKGIIGVERNNHGHVVILKLKEWGVKGLYIHKDKKIGWHTNKETKPIMIDELEEALRKEELKISDKSTLKELILYQEKEDGSMGAPQGEYDDRVMALAIAWQMRKVKRIFNRHVSEKISQYIQPPNYIVDIVNEKTVKSNPEGEIKIWTLPEKYKRYVLSIVPVDDMYEEKNIAIVLDRENYNICAIFESERKNIDKVIYSIKSLAIMYNKAIIGINKSIQEYTIKRILDDYNYGNIVDKIFEDEKDKQSQRIMFINLLQALIREKIIRIYDKDIADRLYLTGIYNSTELITDSKILALGIAAYMVKENPYKPDLNDEEDL